MNDYQQLLRQVLLKRAKGYTTKEKTEEYVVVDGEMTLTKRKVIKRRSGCNGIEDPVANGRVA